MGLNNIFRHQKNPTIAQPLLFEQTLQPHYFKQKVKNELTSAALGMLGRSLGIAVNLPLLPHLADESW